MIVEAAEPAIGISRKITKAKLTKLSVVEVEFDQVIKLEQDGKPLELNGGSSYKGRNVAHQDLIDAFALFHPHFAIICDLPETYGYNGEKLTLHELESELEKISKVKVRSFTVSSFGDSEGITLSGFKELRGGKVLNFNTPFIKFIDDNDPYENAIELAHIKEHVCDQVNAYLDGKVAPNAQLEFEYGSDDEGDLDEGDQ